MMCVIAYIMMKLKLHKEWTNRILEPWQYVHVVVSSTDYSNFFNLRCHKDAQPEILQLSNMMKRLYDSSTPTPLKEGEWHLPYVDKDGDLESLKKISTARCCRVSYMKQEKEPSVFEDEELYERLVGSTPIHASPAEHQATPTKEQVKGNFRGWRQHREEIEKNDDLY
jgi:thymidylate synthase ThyX